MLLRRLALPTVRQLAPRRNLASASNSKYAWRAQVEHSSSPLGALKANAQGLWLERADPHGAVETRWVDAHWLRDRCGCPQCVNAMTRQKLFSTAALPSDLGFQNVRMEPETVQIDWVNDISSTAHTSSYQADEIWQQCVPVNPDLSAGRPVPWESSQMKDIMAQGKNTATYDAWLNDEGTFSSMLQSLRDFGLLFITGVPRSEQAIERLAERIGPLRHTFYGRTFDVKDKPNAQNVAYTSDDLELHMDLLYMKQPPGLQLLHCLTASGTGGMSTFSDSFRAAELLHDDPNGNAAFNTLASYPVSYHYNHPGRAFFDTKPTIEVNSLHESYVAHRRQPTTGMPVLNNVNWSPPFQAPFGADPQLPSGAQFAQYRSAASAFSRLINLPSLKFERLLQPGECVIFNNRRVLHGRTAFVSGPEERFLKGCYLDTDDFESQLRQRGLHKLRAGQPPWSDRQAVPLQELRDSATQL